MVFAFLSTLFRELIKDMEDLKGDKAGKLNTFPVRFGIPKSKILSSAVGILMVGLLLVLGFYLRDFIQDSKAFFIIFALLAQLGLAFYWLVQAREQKDFHRLSQLSKLIMLSGIILLLFVKF